VDFFNASGRVSFLCLPPAAPAAEQCCELRMGGNASSVASPAVGDDDAIAAVELDMNLCHPDPGYFPSGLSSVQLKLE
jgi:hypothetical protein